MGPLKVDNNKPKNNKMLDLKSYKSDFDNKAMI